mmetsp:Transcript_60249/g.54254  ORF Transcript_60249/g.54254 Transcript_60249/m.54254 type:complete len:301 (-) Transcript_60249:334-1236(-)
MMYDYLSTFLSFFEKDSTKALEKQDICHKWLAVKLPTTKRKMWTQVKKQLTELQNRQKTLDEFQHSENAKKTKLSQPKLNFIIDANKKQIRIKSKNIKKITANFYSINIEQLFSNKPFKAGKDALSYVQPTTTLNIETIKKVVLKAKDSDDSTDSEEEAKRQAAMKKKDPNAEVVNTIPFPKNFDEKSNFVLELLGQNTDLRIAKTQYNNSLYVEFNKDRGDVFVGNFSKFPVIKAYVKVYLSTTLNPNGFFLKDGYTDLRGRFNYLSTDVAVPNDAIKAAVLITSDSCGANIYYVDIKK